MMMPMPMAEDVKKRARQEEQIRQRRHRMARVRPEQVRANRCEDYATGKTGF
jgi:hypothetical protein